MNYSSNRNFRIWLYSSAHERLLLRSPLTFPDVEGYSAETSFTIDIEFAGVSYIEMPAMFNGLTISSPAKGTSKVFKNYEKMPRRVIFEIQSWPEVFFVVATSCIIGKSNWLVENRIKNLNLNYDEIIVQATWKDINN